MVKKSGGNCKYFLRETGSGGAAGRLLRPIVPAEGECYNGIIYLKSLYGKRELYRCGSGDLHGGTRSF
ncbi:MAG: hypothetical protein C4520_12975 [Candidatus Abyssobacteria bacterium SURF_5]|uniref:Uncharacterized protein n=1 Tax=Abyssobacteria bacterium (strain SURF_5) TaxID=2093360 RepID=A0A3A4NF64_ABYX5|nr:MAG: hypothetical protein C4520_12975 [Candidatus Abyssubacteria bacterium SURF_5]